MAVNSRKVVIVGCGFVGSASAFALMQSKLFSEMVLIDADQNRAEGEALDIGHGMAFATRMSSPRQKIYNFFCSFSGSFIAAHSCFKWVFTVILPFRIP